MKNIEGKIWSSESLVIFGLYLIKKGEYGYGLLLIHGASLGMKIGELLPLKWCDFIDDFSDECFEKLQFGKDVSDKDSRGYRYLNHFVQRITTNVYQETEGISTHDFVYIKTKSKQVLSTSTLNRELQKLYEGFKVDVYKETLLELNLRELKSNAFEIAWARDMVAYYALSKKAFVAVSKHMGHRTLKNTIELLELEPRDDIELIFNHTEYTIDLEKKLAGFIENLESLKGYLLLNGLANTTAAFEKKRDKSQDYKMTSQELEEFLKSQQSS